MGKTGQGRDDRDLDKASCPGHGPEAPCQSDDFAKADQRCDSACQQPTGSSAKNGQNGESGVSLAAV
jgi:hypothetical protein